MRRVQQQITMLQWANLCFPGVEVVKLQRQLQGAPSSPSTGAAALLVLCVGRPMQHLQLTSPHWLLCYLTRTHVRIAMVHRSMITCMCLAAGRVPASSCCSLICAPSHYAGCAFSSLKWHFVPCMHVCNLSKIPDN